MEGAPKFKPTEKTPYGNNLERIRGTEAEEVLDELSDEDRDELRATLKDVVPEVVLAPKETPKKNLEELATEE